MKISKLRLPNIYQFKNLSLDFTYPLGHAKAGLPLEKICFIGQSGTGKTTILKLIGTLLSRGFVVNIDYEISVTNGADQVTLQSDLARSIKGYAMQNNISYSIRNSDDLNRFISPFINQGANTIFLPADFLSTRDNTAIKSISTEERFFDFSKISIRSIWTKILDEIKQHKQLEREIRKQIFDLSQVSDKTARQIQELLTPLYSSLAELEETDNNPLKKIATSYLDKVLRHFNLKVNTHLSVSEDIDKIEFISLVDMLGNIVPNGLLSTGTSQLLLSSLPFYLLKPNKSIILFDEPERSLYPNIQKLLIDHYAEFTSDSQIFYATHSPIVASCFDPWEVIELKFNDEGYVYQQQYYVGQRHVDNYTIHPKYLTYELILQDVFDVKDTEGESRAKKLTELIMLENQLKDFKSKNDNSSEGFKKTMEEYLNLGKLLSWPTTAVS